MRDYVRRRRWLRRRVREGAGAAAGPTPLLPLANMLGDAACAVGDAAQDSARRLREAAAAAAEGVQARSRSKPKACSKPEACVINLEMLKKQMRPGQSLQGLPCCLRAAVAAAASV